MGKTQKRLATSLARFAGGMWCLLLCVGLLAGCATSSTNKKLDRLIDGQGEIKDDLAQTTKIARRAERKADKALALIKERAGCGSSSSGTTDGPSRQWLIRCMKVGGRMVWRKGKIGMGYYCDAASGGVYASAQAFAGFGHLRVASGCQLQVRHCTNCATAPAKAKPKTRVVYSGGGGGYWLTGRRVYRAGKCNRTSLEKFVRSFGCRLYRSGNVYSCRSKRGACYAWFKARCDTYDDRSALKADTCRTCGGCG